MVSVKSSLLRKLERVLNRRFPRPATVKLEEHDGIIGVVTSVAFAGMESVNRQNLIGEIVETGLTPDERRQVQVIVGVTPDEGTGYLAADD